MELKNKLQLPVIGAPLFIVSNPKLVIEQCKAGIVGSFPALNARPKELLNDWLFEIKEELEIQIEVGAALPASSYDYDFGTVVLHPYRANIKSGVINLTEHPEGRWVSRKDLPSLNWVPADIPIVRALLAQTTKVGTKKTI